MIFRPALPGDTPVWVALSHPAFNPRCVQRSLTVPTSVSLVTVITSEVGERKLITGEDWNDYFREQYGYDNVNWDTAFSSPNDIADMPSSVTRMNPDGLQWYLNQNGIETTPLGQGHLAGIAYENGGGFNAHYNSDYGATYVQYHPGSGHHGEGAYYKVSSGNSFSYSGKSTGTQRFKLDGTVMK